MKLRNTICYILILILLVSLIGYAPSDNKRLTTNTFLQQKEEIIEDAKAYLESCQRENGSHDYPSNINTTAEVCAVLDEFSDVDTTESSSTK